MKADGRVGPAHGHPFGQVPTLEVSEAEGTDSESFTLAETATILGYLDATLPGVRYLPATALEQAKLDMVRDAAMNQLASLYRSIWKPVSEMMVHIEKNIDTPSGLAKRAGEKGVLDGDRSSILDAPRVPHPEGGPEGCVGRSRTSADRCSCCAIRVRCPDWVLDGDDHR